VKEGREIKAEQKITARLTKKLPEWLSEDIVFTGINSEIKFTDAIIARIEGTCTKEQYTAPDNLNLRFKPFVGRKRKEYKLAITGRKG
jgi:hypothetical protein